MFSRIARLRDHSRILRAKWSGVSPDRCVNVLEPRLLFAHSHVAPPLAPSDLAASAGSSSVIRLVWTDHSSKETGFLIQRKKGRSGSWQSIATLPANDSYFRSGHLVASTAYAYRVAAFNGGGTSTFSAPAVATTAGGSVAGIPKLVGSFGVGGDVTQNSHEGGNQIVLSPDGGTIYIVGASSGGITAFTDSGADSSTFPNGILDYNAALPTPIEFTPTPPPHRAARKSSSHALTRTGRSTRRSPTAVASC